MKSFVEYISEMEVISDNFTLSRLKKDYESFTKDLKSNESGTKMKVSDSKIGNNLAWVTMMVKK